MSTKSNYDFATPTKLGVATFEDLQGFIDINLDGGDATFQLVVTKSPGDRMQYVSVIAFHRGNGIINSLYLESTDMGDHHKCIMTVLKWKSLLRAACIDQGAIMAR